MSARPGFRQRIILQLVGSDKTFDELMEGLPGVDRAKLSSNLSQAKVDGLVDRRKDDGQNRPIYRLTKKGREAAGKLGEVPEPQTAAAPLAAAIKRAPIHPKAAHDRDFGCEMQIDGTLTIWQDGTKLTFAGRNALTVIRFIAGQLHHVECMDEVTMGVRQ